MSDYEREQLIEEVTKSVIRRLNASETALARRKPEASLISYSAAAARLGRSPEAVKQMVKRKELKAVHPLGTRRAFIHSDELESYIARRN